LNPWTDAPAHSEYQPPPGPLPPIGPLLLGSLASQRGLEPRAVLPGHARLSAGPDTSRASTVECYPRAIRRKPYFALRGVPTSGGAYRECVARQTLLLQHRVLGGVS